MHMKQGFSRYTKTICVIIRVNRAHELVLYKIKNLFAPAFKSFYSVYQQANLSRLGELKMIFKLMCETFVQFFIHLFHYLCISLIKVQNIFMPNPCKQVSNLNMPLTVSLVFSIYWRESKIIFILLLTIQNLYTDSLPLNQILLHAHTIHVCLQKGFILKRLVS